MPIPRKEADIKSTERTSDHHALNCLDSKKKHRRLRIQLIRKMRNSNLVVLFTNNCGVAMQDGRPRSLWLRVNPNSTSISEIGRMSSA